MSHRDTETITRPSFPRGSSRLRSRGASLGLRARSTTELINQVERGFPFKALLSLEAKSGISTSEFAFILGIPDRTLARRRAAGKLTPEESERLLRISTVFEKAVELFEGDVSAAVKWLTSPRKSFDNQSPLNYSRTELGAHEVENMIGRLEHGVYS